MRWIEAAIPTAAGEIDALCERLGALGVEGISIEDEADFRRFLEENRQYWDYVDESLEQRFAGKSRVKFYLQDDEAGRAALAIAPAFVRKRKRAQQLLLLNVFSFCTCKAGRLGVYF